MNINDAIKGKILQAMHKQDAWERDVAIKQLEQLEYELGEKIEPDYFREVTKKTDFDEWWKNYIRSRMSQDDVPDTNVGKTDFKPGDKFILELGAERKMFDEFEIKGTDLYVETRLLEKLTRYEPEVKSDNMPYKKPEIIYCKDCRYRDPEDKKCDHGHGIVWQLPRPDDWFCADGKR